MKIFYSLKFKFIIFLIFLSIISTFNSIYVYNFKYDETTYKNMVIKISEKYNVSENYTSYVGKLKYSNFISDKFLIYIPNESEILKKGDIISVYSNISISKYYNNFNEFNYAKYLNSIKIIGSIFVDDFSIIEMSSYNQSYREKFENFIDKKFDSDISKIVKAMIYGQKNKIPESIQQVFNKSGISHILVVSGSSIYILSKIIEKIFKRIKYNEYIQIVIITMYFFFCKFVISIFRAYLMYVFKFINKKFKLNFNSNEIFLISVLIILIYNPYYIFSYSFWYTILAVLGIKLYFSSIENKLWFYILKLCKYKNVFEFRNKYKFKILKYIIKILSMSASVQIFLFPISLYIR